MKFSDLKAALEVATPLEKSLPTGVRGLRSVAPKYSAEQIEHGASMALAHGAIDAQTATAISSALALGGPGSIPQNIISVLEGRGG
ncbi:hypothetical protein [Paraburkholderia sp. BCC1876]|uniref:hypothetical protein n=1 Tax=Paraburkholderia sp. BCC1876 TaxID=2676303 RepID=UPI00158FD663|nr:hypothetical protein [Paraburkholderia sp. BCC1876]